MTRKELVETIKKMSPVTINASDGNFIVEIKKNKAVYISPYSGKRTISELRPLNTSVIKNLKDVVKGSVLIETYLI